jgi:sortase (surface protein transpeptidase)
MHVFAHHPAPRHPAFKPGCPWQRWLLSGGLALIAITCAACLPSRQSASSQGQRPRPTTPPFSQPTHLSIPSLGVNAAILPVGTDRYGAMEAPGAGHPASDPIWGSAFWWKFGAKPGQPGNAVLAGHVDRDDGSHAAFWNLGQIQPGDSIIITEQAGQTFTFQVTRVTAFPIPDGGPDDPVIQRVFGPATTANLNLITCYGDWIGTEFNERLVVFSTLVAKK